MSSDKQNKISLHNDNRFESLVHYICAYAPHEKMGSVKLNKILWFIDKLAFGRWGRSVSGETAYIKRRFGPVPRDILRTLDNLVQEGLLEITEGIRYGYKYKKFESKEQPNKSVFNDEEISLIKDVIESICNNHTADSISNLSHDKVWEEARMGEEIPLIATLAENSSVITEEDIKWVQEELNKRKER